METQNSPPNALRKRKQYYPRVTAMTIKKTSLLIDELDIRREEESNFKLTPYEKEVYEKLKEVFHSDRPSEQIQDAICDEKKLKEVRKDYLTASKIEREQKKIKEKADNDAVGMLLLASGAPIMLIGGMLMDSFFIPAVTVIAAGVSMCVPALIREVIYKRKARKKLKEAEIISEELSEEIDELTENIDNVCKKYNIPINCCERLKYLCSLNEAAVTYESLIQKESDYELLCQINGSDAISREISFNLQKLTGLSIRNEDEYKTVIQNLQESIEF